ncbi:MAG: ATP-binding cassette domain-containing protein [Clostridia bacterium]|nr:ATP-binding cassette domain-containing protein [Clostridia bacterium]
MEGVFELALLLRADRLRVLFGVRTLFTIQTIEIFDGDRIGLVGSNGVGKSTLISVLHGDVLPDSGTVTCYSGSAVVRQFGDADEGEADPAIRSHLSALSDAHEGISGGEMERLRIARALSKQTPLLFADEPTTNLDFAGLANVRKALARHQGALVLVSHDRSLLDDLCTTIWEIEAGVFRIYPGNYSAYLRQKALERDRQRFEYEQYRTEQARLRSAIVGIKESSRSTRTAPRRMGNSEARLHRRGAGIAAKKVLDRAASALQSRLEALDAKERPREDAPIRMGLAGRGGVVSAAAVRVEGLTLCAGGKPLLMNESFTIPAGRRTVLVGPNGCGKTTLLRAIRDQAPGVTVSPGITIGWFGQETLDTLDPDKTLLDNVMEKSVLPAHEARTLLARMNLAAADMEKRPGILSGGERSKAALARLMAGNESLLLMDEPGNHLDLHALEALEEMLAAYTGSLLLVSHDRRMIDRVAQQLLFFEGRQLVCYEGNLTEYEKRLTPEPAAGLSEDIVRMRMSALLGRMGSPKKGETRDTLEEQYRALEEQLKTIRK